MHQQRESSQHSGASLAPNNASKKRPSAAPLSPTVKRRVLSKTLETTAMSTYQAHSATRSLWLRNLRDSDIKMCYAILNLAVQAQSPDYVATAEMLEEFLDLVFDGWSAEKTNRKHSSNVKDFHGQVESCMRKGFVGISAAGARVEFVCTISTRTGQLNFHYADALHPVMDIKDLGGVCWKDARSVEDVKSDVIRQAVAGLVRSVRDHNMIQALSYARNEIKSPANDPGYMEKMKNIWNGNGNGTAQNVESALSGRDASKYFHFVQGHCLLRNLPPGFQFDDESVFPPRMVEGGARAKLPCSFHGAGSSNGLSTNGAAAGGPKGS